MSKNIHACFISYRHPGDPDADKYVQAFVKELKKHLAWYLPNPSVFLDSEHLGVGDFFDPKLADALFHSACLVIFFSPCHFDPNHPYCAMEYKAMLDLEQKRFGGKIDLQNQGLIFPVVFRGSVHLPEEIRCRQFEDFEDVLMYEDFEKKKSKEIERLAKRIWDCYRELYNAGAFANPDCTQFRFPDKKEIMQWINEVTPLPLMPFRRKK